VSNIQYDKMASENEICRQIVLEISRFEVSDRQRIMLIYLLSLELESVEFMQTITSTIREFAGDIFLTDETKFGV